MGRRTLKLIAASSPLVGALLCSVPGMAADKQFIKGSEQTQSRAYSPAVVTTGGKVIWLAGQTTVTDADGKSLSGNFEGQARDVFRRMGGTLEKAGARLSDIVTMTVFITDPRFGDKFVSIRREIFGDNFPASALITVSGLATPDRLVEIQAVAVKE